MIETYQKPNVEIVDFNVNDHIMDVTDYSEGNEWDN